MPPPDRSGVAQFSISFLIGVSLAACEGAMFWLSGLLIMPIGGEAFGPAGFCCVFPSLAWSFSFVAGTLLHRYVDPSAALLKCILATPTSYLVLFAVTISMWNDPRDFRDPGIWVVGTILLITSCLLTYGGFRRAGLHKAGSPSLRCARCGYNLFANTSGICPECGTPIPEDEKQVRPTNGPDPGEKSV